MLAQQAFGQLITSGSCPDITVPYPDFDAEAYGGDWYLQQVNLATGSISGCPVLNTDTNFDLDTYEIISTDYTSFSVNLNCVNVDLFDFHIETAFIISRAETISEEALAAANAALNERTSINSDTMVSSSC